MRSGPQHRRFWGLLRAMYTHWPETADFQPESEEHLRAWVTIKSGHYSVHSIDTNTPSVPQFVAVVQAALRAAGSYAFVQADGDAIKILKPKSIAYARLSPREFTALNERIEEVYRVETNLDPNAVLENNERAA